MIEDILYGIIVSLMFIGIVSLVYFLILHTFRPKNNGRYIINVTDKMTKSEIYDLFFSAYIRNIVYGGRFCSDLVIVVSSLNAPNGEYIEDLSDSFSGVRVIESSEILSAFE